MMQDFYVDLLKNKIGVKVFTTSNDDSFANYWLSSILIDPELTNGIDRENLRLVFKFENIESSLLWNLSIYRLFLNLISIFALT